MLKKIWTTAKSNKYTIQEKLQEAKNKLSELDWMGWDRIVIFL